VTDPVRAIADAVLYEGYVLWPYRSSALKNQRRWTFGGVFPEAHSALHPDDRCVMRAECLMLYPPASDPSRVEVTVRFLHVVRRNAQEGAGYDTWDEAIERELGPGPIDIPAGRERDGAISRSWEALAGVVDVRAAPVAPGVARVTVEVVNRTPWRGDDREEALRRSFCSTHAVLRTGEGAFVSLTDPPEHLRAAAAQCCNEGVWPVLVGEPGARDTVLASPIILEDHPQIAPESQGDLFDGGEIDQMLVLNILTLTDEEREAMRAADPRTREILERTEALTPEELMRLHGRLTAR
jgi:hypothetical protein